MHTIVSSGNQMPLRTYITLSTHIVHTHQYLVCTGDPARALLSRFLNYCIDKHFLLFIGVLGKLTYSLCCQSTPNSFPTMGTLTFYLHVLRDYWVGRDGLAFDRRLDSPWAG